MQIDRKHVLDQFFQVRIGLFQVFSSQKHISDEFWMILDGFGGFFGGFRKDFGGKSMTIKGKEVAKMKKFHGSGGSPPGYEISSNKQESAK